MNSLKKALLSVAALLNALFTLNLPQSICGCAALDNARDCAALTQLAAAWRLWPEDTARNTSMCSWRGIECTETGRVEALCVFTVTIVTFLRERNP